MSLPSRTSLRRVEAAGQAARADGQRFAITLKDDLVQYTKNAPSVQPSNLSRAPKTEATDLPRGR